jgi:hypothetical protein
LIIELIETNKYPFSKMQSKAKNIEEYLDEVPDERKEAFNKLRETILTNLPKGYVEGLAYGMIGYVVPHSIYAKGYHVNPKLPLGLAFLASQKNFIAFYHMALYANTELHDWFVKEYTTQCKHKPDMGKSCIRFKNSNQIPYPLIGELMKKLSVEKWVNLYEENLKATKKG